MVNTYTISGSTLPLIALPTTTRIPRTTTTTTTTTHVRRRKLHTAYIFPFKVIYVYDTAVNGGTKRRNEAGLFSLPNVVKRNYEGDTGLDENKQITHWLDIA
jgi:hypothetical protein